MRITEKDLKEFNQLDRIEFRQRYLLLKEQQIDFNPFGLLYTMFAIMGFIVLLAVSFFNINPDATATLLNLLPIIFKVFKIGFIVLLALEILFYLYHLKRLKELKAEYFTEKLEVKKKR